MFGYGHGVVVVSTFQELVEQAGWVGVLEFRPSVGREMIALCLWTRTTEVDGSELYSSAAITELPPPRWPRPA